MTNEQQKFMETYGKGTVAQGIVPPVKSLPSIYSTVSDPVSPLSLQESNTFSKGQLKIGGAVINVSTAEDIQTAINKVVNAGGGQVILGNGTHTVTTDLNLYSNVTLTGQNSGSSIIDFGNKAYGIKAIGTNVYTTGTVTVNKGSTSVSGSLTSWTSAMVGRYILLSGLWYPISAVGGATSLTISVPFADVNLSGGTYIISSIIKDMRINNITIQNSTSTAINIQYALNPLMADIYVINCSTGLGVAHSSDILYEDSIHLACGTAISMNDGWYGEIHGVAITDSTVTGISMTSCNYFDYRSVALLNSANDGVSITSCTNITFSTLLSNSNGSAGINFVSGNSGSRIIQSNFVSNGTDGIKLSASTSSSHFSSNLLTKNGGYGWNVANANCNTNYFIYNLFSANSSGTYSDSGTATVIHE